MMNAMLIGEQLQPSQTLSHGMTQIPPGPWGFLHVRAGKIQVWYGA